jgi:hypothetical protein
MKTNSKEVRNAIKTHILECVYNFEGEEFKTIKEACTHMYNEFERVANYPTNIHNIPNDQKRFSDYLNGLPFNFLFYYSDVKDFLNGLGINPNGKEFTDEETIKRYHYLIYSEMIKNK